MAVNLVGKLAFVTGGGSGIGRATCQVLAREGAVVVAADKNVPQAMETVQMIAGEGSSKLPHMALGLEVSQSDSVQNALNAVLEKHGKPPSIIVNSAGITRDNFLLSLSEQDFDQVLDVNLKGSFLVIQAFSRALVEQKITGASIVNISSIVGKYGNMGQSNYCASKAGVELLTKTAAKELGKHGIRVNVILPGIIKTPIIETVPEKVKNKFLAQIALGRLGKPEEIAEVISFLSSDKSSYVNGASIEITGGM